VGGDATKLRYMAWNGNEGNYAPNPTMCVINVCSWHWSEEMHA
jgi:hypothetical protein